MLKALDTFGNCQRPVFLLGVSQQMQQKTKTIVFNWSSKMLENNDRKNTGKALDTFVNYAQKNC